MNSLKALAAAFALVSGLWLAGCANPFGFSAAAGMNQPFREPGVSMQAAMHSVVIGQSTKDAVLAALGPATVVSFNSGYAVWVYRKNPRKSEAAHPELVILFAPSGVVQKTRIRPGRPD